MVNVYFYIGVTKVEYAMLFMQHWGLKYVLRLIDGLLYIMSALAMKRVNCRLQILFILDNCKYIPQKHVLIIFSKN